MPSTKRVLHHPTAKTVALWSIAILFNTVVVDRVRATDLDALQPDDPTWRELSIDPGPSDPADGGWAIGDGANPRFPLPVDPLRGRWMRFSATVDRASRGLGLRINASSALQRTASVPVTCDGHPAMSRCTTSFWMPPDTEKADAVVWADREAGRYYAPRVEVAEFAELAKPGRTIGHRADAFIAAVRAGYYRTDEVDWADVERSIAAMPAPPDDLDPLPGIAQVLRSRLPGNKHVVIWPSSLTRTPASDVTMPTCGAIGDGIGVVALPGLAQMTGDAPATYAKTLHDCLMRGTNKRAWIVNLRPNTGGNMYPMIGGLAPLLPAGGLYAFANGHRVATAQVGLDRGGVTINRQRVFGALDAGSRVGPPVIVVFGATCSSSCEQTANALAVRPRTLFIGEPTAGYLTANTPLLVNDAYVMLLTSGYTQDPCGRVLEDNLSPDVAVDRVAARSIAELLALVRVNDWLVQQLSRPSKTAKTAPRCDPAPRSASR